MRVLLDTHAFIWWVTNDSQLSDVASACIAIPKSFPGSPWKRLLTHQRLLRSRYRCLCKVIEQGDRDAVDKSNVMQQLGKLS